MIIQQGDVLIRKIDSIPTNAIKVEKNVLAEGEVTGHKHQLEVTEKTDLIDFYELNGKIYLNVKKFPVKVLHQEHQIVTIPVGIWEVDRVKEYDHFLEETKKIQD